MTGMAAANAEGRIQRSGTRRGMIAVMLANGSNEIAHPHAMNSTAIQNRPTE